MGTWVLFLVWALQLQSSNKLAPAKHQFDTFHIALFE